jgi:branched-chain amino acid transport system permease protein
MDWQIALLLGQDGVTNGVIYALLSLALVLVFTVTRVIFIPQGEFVAFGALTLAALQAGKTPGTMWLLMASGAVIAIVDGMAALRSGDRAKLLSCLAWNLGYPALLAVLVVGIVPPQLPMIAQVLLALAIVVPLGPAIYRLAFKPLAEASVLVLLIVAVAVHLTLVGLGLYFFGAEGSRTAAFTEANFALGELSVSGQALWMVVASALIGVGLYFFFERTLYGKALRATAINRKGAHLVGISSEAAGKWAFTLAAAIGAFSGVLIAPITTIYYDTGFLIGLKGFVGAIIGGLASYPLAAAGALLVGLLESYSSFWASAFKEVIVFSLIIPVLLWRSLRSGDLAEDDA